MRDEFSGERLPDIPNAGYSTRREREASDAIMFLMRGLERNREWLLRVVCEGREKWRKTTRAIWRGLLPDTELHQIIDDMYAHLVLQAGPNPTEQLEVVAAMAGMTAAQKSTWMDYAQPQNYTRCPHCNRDWLTVPCCETHRHVANQFLGIKAAHA